MNVFSIKDLENLSGIKAHTIRMWEQRYSFLKPHRSETNIRYYTNEELKTILNISLLNKYGFKISSIAKMKEEEMNEKILSLTDTEAQQERLIHKLIKCMVDLDLEKFEQVLDNYILPKGIQKAILHLIFPFLERIGVLWSTNHINPAQEHLTSNIIKRKLMVGIESAVIHKNSDKTILLFLPENEHHEMGLLFMYYLLKVRGIHVLYLGANAPLKDIAFVANLKKPHQLYMHLTALTHNFNLDKYISRVNAAIPGIPLLISGRPVKDYKRKDSKLVQFKRSLSEVISYVDSL